MSNEILCQTCYFASTPLGMYGCARTSTFQRTECDGFLRLHDMTKRQQENIALTLLTGRMVQEHYDRCRAEEAPHAD